MSKVSLRQSTLVLLSSLLALGTIACGNHNPIISTSEAANTLPKSKTAKASSTPQPSPSQAAAKPPNFYQQALDTATGATVIGEQAFVREDWALATSRWQEAIRLLKAVPTSIAILNWLWQFSKLKPLLYLSFKPFTCCILFRIAIAQTMGRLKPS